MKNCTVLIVDDEDLEPEETFLLKLAEPMSADVCAANIGPMDTVKIYLTNHDDGKLNNTVFLLIVGTFSILPRTKMKKYYRIISI